MKLTLGQIADWIHAEGDFRDEDVAYGYSIDSRTIGAGDLFFAVKGERLDGHEFVEGALKDGAVAAVVSMRWVIPAEVDQSKLLRVPDGEDCVLAAMQKLATAVRRHWGKRVIGITGSAGKTTTKEAVATVLSAKFNVLKSAGNLNNAFGVPLQVLRLEPEHEIAVLEMGMNHAGEIAALAKIAEPNWAVVSNVAPVHLEHFPEGISGIAKAKYELVQSLPADGIAVLNVDDEYVGSFGRDMGSRAVFYGLRDVADVRGQNVQEAGTEGTTFTVVVNGEAAPAKIALMGRHNVYNALAAITAGLQCGMSLKECVAALAGLLPSDRRGQILEYKGATLINDVYNSNPHALGAMVEALRTVKANRHIVIAGEMLELGPEGPALHEVCGRVMGKKNISIVIGVRGLAQYLVDGAKATGANAIFVATPEEAGEWLANNLQPGDAVLLKASRGVRLERALQTLGVIH